MSIVDQARELAHRAHADQVDKAGRPYIEHVARVAAAVADDPEAETVAWLHDVLEDGGANDCERVNDFPTHVKCAVALLTRCTDYDLDSYYYGIAQNPIALRVKLADIADNSDEARLSLLDDTTAARLRRKYAKALTVLTGDTPNG